MNSLQLVAHIPLLNVIMPGNAKIAFDMAYGIATFDYFPIEWFIELIEEPLSGLDNSDSHELSVSESLNDAFESTNPFINLSQEAFILVIGLVYGAMIYLLSKMFCSGKCKEFTDWYLNRLFPSFLIRFLIEEYLTICIVLLIKLYTLDFMNWFETTSSVFAISSALFIISLPVWIWKFLYKNHKLIFFQDR